MCAPTLIDFAIGTSGRTSSWYRRRFYKPNCSFAVQIVAKVSTRPNKHGPQVIESIDAQMRASNALGAGGRAFKSPRPDHPEVTDLFAPFAFGGPSAPVANWGVLGFPEASSSYNFIYSRFPSTAGSGPSSPSRARLSSPCSGCFVGRKGISRQVSGTAAGRSTNGEWERIPRPPSAPTTSADPSRLIVPNPRRTKLGKAGVLLNPDQPSPDVDRPEPGIDLTSSVGWVPLRPIRPLLPLFWAGMTVRSLYGVGSAYRILEEYSG